MAAKKKAQRSGRTPGVPPPSSCMGARCAASSARPPRPSSSIRATSMTAPSRPRPASRATRKAIVYSRYANPTVAMFEARMCALEGAHAARGTSSGMAAVAASLLCHLKAGDHVVSARALFGSCRYIVEDLLPRYGIETTLIDGRDLKAWEAAMQTQHARLLLRDADQPGARARRYRRRGEDRQESGRARRGRQRVRHAASAAADAARRRHRRLFRDQAYRRPGALPRRRGAGLEGVHRGEAAQFPQAHRAVAEPVQRLGDAEGAGDADRARRAARRLGGGDRRLPRRAARKSRACSIPAAPTIRRPRSPSGR